MTDDEQLFGHDMRHHPPLRIMPTSRFAYEHITDNRQYDGIRRKRMKELDKFIVLFDAPGIIGGDYMFMSSCWRYVIPTWDYGRIEVDVFKENYLLLPEQEHRIHICDRLKTAGYLFQIIGELKFINIKRL